MKKCYVSISIAFLRWLEHIVVLTFGSRFLIAIPVSMYLIAILCKDALNNRASVAGERVKWSEDFVGGILMASC
ncbi:hypothetical protein NDI49_03175 [Trichocoleus sp. ST-U3]